MLELCDFNNRRAGKTTEDCKLPDKVDSVQVSYDGGRLEIMVNDVVVYENLGAGNDFCVSIDKR